MWVPVYFWGAHTGPLCGLFCGPVKSACHQWLNVFFLHFYGAKMFLSCHPSTVPVSSRALREAKVNCAAIFCRLIGHLLLHMWLTWHNSGADVLILIFFCFVFCLSATMIWVQTARWSLGPEFWNEWQQVIEVEHSDLVAQCIAQFTDLRCHWPVGRKRQKKPPVDEVLLLSEMHLIWAIIALYDSASTI